jgi:peptide/nickel transport system substrate-binding protein
MRHLIIFILLPIIFSSCVSLTKQNYVDNEIKPNSTNSGTKSNLSTFQTSTFFPDPGPFKVVQIKDKAGNISEFLVSRGELGKFGGNLTVSSFGSGPKTFNCWASADAESAGLSLLLFERLVEIDAWSGKPYPRLAKSIKISPNNCEYIFELRKGLKWSDGKPITADDVVFTFSEIVANGFGNSSFRDVLSAYDKFPEVTKIDDYTIKFHTFVPFAPLLSSIRSIPIAPKHIFQSVVKRPTSEFHTFWDINVDPKNIVVSGPFKLSRYVPGQRVELVRNPHYAMLDKNKQQLPYLDKFVQVIVPDQNTQLLKFYGNEIDLLDIRSVRGFDVARLKQHEKNGDFRLYNLGPDDGTVFLMFNMCQRKNLKTNKFYVDPIKQKWFNNKNFRLAISHAISRKRIIENLLRGVGVPLYTHETPASLFFNKNLKPYPQDLELSAKLLKEGGFQFKNGRLYDKENNRVEFTLLTNAGNSVRDAICVMLINDLKKLGIKVNYQPIDFNILIDKTETSLDWEAVVMALTGDRIEPYSGANIWKSDGRIHMFDQRLPNDKGKTIVNDARDWEKQIDLLFDKAATTLDDKKRHLYFDQYQQIVYEEQPFIYLYSILDITAASTKLGNYKPTPFGINYLPFGSLHNIEEIYINKGTD